MLALALLLFVVYFVSLLRRRRFGYWLLCFCVLLLFSDLCLDSYVCGLFEFEVVADT